LPAEQIAIVETTIQLAVNKVENVGLRPGILGNS
jgi:hypothetical protein